MDENTKHITASNLTVAFYMAWQANGGEAFAPRGIASGPDPAVTNHVIGTYRHYLEQLDMLDRLSATEGEGLSKWYVVKFSLTGEEVDASAVESLFIEEARKAYLALGKPQEFAVFRSIHADRSQVELFLSPKAATYFADYIRSHAGEVFDARLPIDAGRVAGDSSFSTAA